MWLPKGLWCEKERDSVVVRRGAGSTQCVYAILHGLARPRAKGIARFHSPIKCARVAPSRVMAHERGARERKEGGHTGPSTHPAHTMLYLLDYGAGSECVTRRAKEGSLTAKPPADVRSLANSIRKLGYDFEWVKSPEDIAKADVSVALSTARPASLIAFPPPPLSNTETALSRCRCLWACNGIAAPPRLCSPSQRVH